jgi:hypothetical protein
VNDPDAHVRVETTRVDEAAWVVQMTGFRLGRMPEGVAPEPFGDGVFYASPAEVAVAPPAWRTLPWVCVDGRSGTLTPLQPLAPGDAPPRTLWFNAALLALLLRGGLLVHAAGAVLHGRGLIFPAVSGTGKSTLSGLLEAAFPGSVVCDERIAARRDATPDGAMSRWTMAGTPWASTAGIARKTSAPLAALVFLEQAAECAIAPISAADAARRMLPQISVDWSLPTLADRGVAALDALLSTAPAFVFRFPKSPAAADFIAAWAETLPLECVEHRA